MSKRLHDFFGGHDSSVAAIIGDFEPLSGHAGVDIKMAADLRQANQKLFSSMGLDPSDTTGRELYFSLLVRASRDDAVFSKKLGLEPSSSEAKSALAVANLVSKLVTKQHAFVPKRSVLKRLLQQRPPTAALKLLHYRSFDSMFKRCSMTLIIAASELAQSQKWQASFRASLAGLSFNDFEERPIECLSVTAKRWESLHKKLLAKNGHSVYTVRPAGGIVIVPSSGNCRPGQTLLFALAALLGSSHLYRLSTLTKRCLMDSGLRSNYADVLYAANRPGTVQVRSVDVLWQHQHRLMATNSDVMAIFEPHISSEHVRQNEPVHLLNKSLGGLSFWLLSLQLGMADGGVVVSCNLFDVLRNLVYERSFGRHTSDALQNAIRGELMHRYLNQDFVREALRNKLIGSTTFDEPLMLELDTE